jgi:hypothetical protein
VTFSTAGPSFTPATLASITGVFCTTRCIVTRRPPSSRICTPLGVCVSLVIWASVPTSCTSDGSVMLVSSGATPVSGFGRGRKTATYGFDDTLAATSAATRPSCVTSHGWYTPGKSGRLEKGNASTGGIVLMLCWSCLTRLP